MNKRAPALLPVLLALCLLLSACGLLTAEPSPSQLSYQDLDQIPDFSGSPYVVLQDNQPDFSQEMRTETAFEHYSPLDALGRCGAAFANVCPETMPTEERGEIGQVRPSGWQTVRYDFVDGHYLYNRCHLIGFQLTGENANAENLITGTRYMNVQGMLPFENLVADYVHETGNHVLYRVTPVFQGNELVARGVVMEALSVEDEGAGVSFHVFCYNNQPGVEIDYGSGESWEAPLASGTAEDAVTYILNTNSKKFHDPACSGAADIKAENRQEYSGSRELLLAQGYSPCGRCDPA